MIAMARLATEDRRRQIGDAALKAFSEKGFRLTQVADIAKIAGAAPGTLYLYAPSKEVLFLMAMQRALGEEPHDLPSDQGELLKWIEDKVVSARAYHSLIAATTGDPEAFPTPETVIGEVWDSIERLAPTIRLIEKCAPDWPDLAALFYKTLRPSLLNMLQSYLERGIERGLVRQVPDTRLGARLIVETIAWFAIHRVGDVDGRYYDAAAAKRTTVDALTHAFSANNQGDQNR
jgi:AcrR family transcriptional regulator